MVVKIETENLNKRKIDVALVNKMAEIVLKKAGYKNIALDIIFINNHKIRVLNRKYLGIDTATDVIAFPACQGMDEIGDTRFLGDIAISSDKAWQNSEVYGVTFVEEILRYVIHGILHLLGYEDNNEKNRKKMVKKENEFLEKIKKKL